MCDVLDMCTTIKEITFYLENIIKILIKNYSTNYKIENKILLATQSSIKSKVT